MKLALLGGTGRTGRLLLDQALQRGHTLTVLARDPAQLPTRPGLQSIQGDARDPDRYAELLQGADAVLCALGPVKGGPGDVMTRAAQHLSASPSHHGALRLVTLTGAGVPQPGDAPKLIDQVIRTLLRLTQPAVLADAVQHAQLIRGSALAWTIVRVPRLTDGPVKPVIAGPVGSIRPFITRASAAQYMLDALDDPETIGQAPAISN
jgi:putative NADH-flavin reductase